MRSQNCSELYRYTVARSDINDSPSLKLGNLHVAAQLAELLDRYRQHFGELPENE